MSTRLKNRTNRPIPVAVHRRSFHEPPVHSRPAEKLLMGSVKILKRGETLTAFLPARSDLSPEKDLKTASTTILARGDLSLGSTHWLGSDPETVKMELPITIPGKGFATGGYVTSPHPSLVPVPGFLSGAEMDTRGLRRLMEIGLV